MLFARKNEIRARFYVLLEVPSVVVAKQNPTVQSPNKLTPSAHLDIRISFWRKILSTLSTDAAPHEI